MRTTLRTTEPMMATAMAPVVGLAGCAGTRSVFATSQVAALRRRSCAEDEVDGPATQASR